MGVIIREHTVSKTSEVSVGVVNPGFKRTARLGKRQSYLTYTKSLHMPAGLPTLAYFTLPINLRDRLLLLPIGTPW